MFGTLALLRDEKGKTVFRVESGALAEVLSRIEERANYGDTASGRFLADELAKEPFGWDFEVVRLLVLSLHQVKLWNLLPLVQAFLLNSRATL